MERGIKPNFEEHQVWMGFQKKNLEQKTVKREGEGNNERVFNSIIIEKGERIFQVSSTSLGYSNKCVTPVLDAENKEFNKKIIKR